MQIRGFRNNDEGGHQRATPRRQGATMCRIDPLEQGMILNEFVSVDVSLYCLFTALYVFCSPMDGSANCGYSQLRGSGRACVGSIFWGCIFQMGQTY